MQSGLTCTLFFFFVLFGKIHVCWDKDSFFPFCFDSWQRLIKDENFEYLELFVCLFVD